ncbi:MAG: hypothetical protein AAGI06_15255 [Pseudomonadota bacterium]
MKQVGSKYGTDPRYPLWSGGVLDRRFFKGATALALLLNWGALGLVHHDMGQSDAGLWGLAVTTRFGLALVICCATGLLLRHKDKLVTWGTRAYACGLPLAINALLLWQRL